MFLSFADFEDLDRQRRLAGGHVDNDRARPCTRHDSLRAQRHLANVAGIADDRENDIRGRRQLRDRSGHRGSSCRQGFGLLNRAVVNRRLVPGRNQVPAHRRAHDPRADPADPRFPRCELESHGRLQRECSIRFAYRASSPLRALPGTIEILSEIAPCQ